jgi:hypothetical protein
MWSRNLEHEETKARYGAVKVQPQWVVTPGKQTTTNKHQAKKVQITSLQFGTELGLCGSNFKTPVIVCVHKSHYKQNKRHLLST